MWCSHTAECTELQKRYSSHDNYLTLKMVREHFSYEERLMELGLSSLEKTRPREDLVAEFQDLKGAYKQKGHHLFTWPDSDRTRGNVFKLEKGET